MTDQFKFSVGQVLRHRASGEKAIVVKAESGINHLRGATFAYYEVSSGVGEQHYEHLSPDATEIIFELVEPEKIGCGCQGIIDLCKCLHARQVQRLIP